MAIASAAISYAMMNLMMTGAPVAMVGCSLTPADASWAIQWHVPAMYVPSLFHRPPHQELRGGGEDFKRGPAAGRRRRRPVGGGVRQVRRRLIFLGLGWNFGFIGATTLLTETYLPAERAKVQGINDFTVAATTATASFLSGQIPARFGWHGINVTLIPFALIDFSSWSGCGGIRPRARPAPSRRRRWPEPATVRL